MSKLYKVTLEQQEAVSRLLTEGECSKTELISRHEESPDDWAAPQNRCLNGMSLHTLAALVFFPDMVEVEATPIQRAVRSFKTWVPQSSYEEQAALLRAFSEMSFFNIISNQQYGELCKTTFVTTPTQAHQESNRRMIQKEVSSAVAFINAPLPDPENAELRLRYLEGFVYGAELFKGCLGLNWLNIHDDGEDKDAGKN